MAACALLIWLIRQCQLVIIRVQRPDMWQALPVRFSAGGDNVVRLVKHYVEQVTSESKPTSQLGVR